VLLPSSSTCRSQLSLNPHLGPLPHGPTPPHP
jgi:hypothetical protein